MRATAPAPPGRRDQGPVRQAMQALLEGAGITGAEVTWAERSPVGARALRVRWDGGDLAAVAARLTDAVAVDTLTVRSPHVYVRLTTEALCRWVCAGGPPADPSWCVPGPRGHTDAPGTASGSLSEGRVEAVAHALGRLHALTGRSRDGVTAGAPSGRPVGAVDVPHGPLRSRHGGLVTPADLLAECAERHGGARAGALWCLVMTRPRRTRRLRLDDDCIAGAGRDLAAVLAARALAAAPPPVHGRADAPVRALAGQIELVAGGLDRAVRAADPSYAVAALGSLAGAVRAAAGHHPVDDPLWPAAAGTLDLLGRIAGVLPTTPTTPTTPGRLP